MQLSIEAQRFEHAKEIAILLRAHMLRLNAYLLWEAMERALKEGQR
jgi:hypothetical protein